MTNIKMVAGDFNHDGYSDVTAFYDYGGAETRPGCSAATPTGSTHP